MPGTTVSVPGSAVRLTRIGLAAALAAAVAGCAAPTGAVPQRKSVGASASGADTKSPHSGGEANSTFANEAASATPDGWDTIPLTRRSKGMSNGDFPNGGGLSDGGGNLSQISFATEGGD